MKEQIEKQAIEEMASFMWAGRSLQKSYVEIAETLYNAGYRKQKEGEWKLVEKEAFWVSNMKESLETGKPTKELMPVCSVCKTLFGKIVLEFKFCPNCGARMSGGNNNGYNNK